MSREDQSEILKKDEPVSESNFIGPLAFAITTVAMLVFFWWLLIYDHGVVSVH